MTDPQPRPFEPQPLDKASLGAPSIVPDAAEQVWVAVPDGASETGSSPSLGAVEPTQLRKPWRATVRTAFQALVALCVLFPILVQTSGLNPDSIPWLGGAVLVAAAVSRIMALPQLEVFLRRFVPFLSASGKQPQ